MKKKIIVLLLVACCLGCSKKERQVTDCPVQACTYEFVSINVQFQDKNGNVVEVKNYSVVNKRTNESIIPANQQGVNEAGYYTIVNDSFLKKLSTKGDEVVVTATHPTSGQTKSTTYKIAGGCNCHVARISGPQVIKFD